MADGEWNKVCALMTAPVPSLLSRLLPASLLQEDGVPLPCSVTPSLFQPVPFSCVSVTLISSETQNVAPSYNLATTKI